jgi:arsenate reductase
VTRRSTRPARLGRVELWTNPSCSKCVTARATLDAVDAAYTERDYLLDPPTPAELGAVLDRLRLAPWEAARLAEPVAAELGLADAPRERDRWLAVMCAYPELIQRPIILLDDGTALIGRSAEALRLAVDSAGCAVPAPR